MTGDRKVLILRAVEAFIFQNKQISQNGSKMQQLAKIFKKNSREAYPWTPPSYFTSSDLRPYHRLA